MITAFFQYISRALFGARSTHVRPPGRRMGRRMVGDKKWGENKLPSPAEQHRDWLKRSCLADKDIPGELRAAERTIEFFDINGKPLMYDLFGTQVQYAQRRQFTSSDGVEPEHKYLSPKDQPLHIYYPQNKKGFDWRKWAQDPTQRKIFVEGATKAACMVNFGMTAGGLLGCSGYSDSKRGHPLLLDFDEYNFEGCHVYWVPDRDRKPKAVQDVFRAGEEFAFLLHERGAIVHIVTLPFLEGLPKIGADDFLLDINEKTNKKAAKEAMEKLLAATPEWEDHELNDGGNARRWVKMCGHRFRHATRWLEYVRGCWQEDGLKQHRETLVEMLEGMLTFARRSGNASLRKEIKPYITKPHISSALFLAESDPIVAALPDQFDKWPLWLNGKDRTVELPTVIPPKKGKQQ